MGIQAFGHYAQLSLEDCRLFEDLLFSNYEDEKRHLDLKRACYTEALSCVVRKCEEALLRKKSQGAPLRIPMKVYRQMDAFGNHYYLFR